MDGASPGRLMPAALVLILSSISLATHPDRGKHFDCSDAPGATSCASDDTGCVPQTKDDPSGGVVSTLQCGDALTKAFSAAVRAVIKCHKMTADSVLQGAPVDDEACESGGAKSAKAVILATETE